MLLRGLGKLVAVVVVAGVVGAALGIGLAKLSGSDDGAAPSGTSGPTAPSLTTRSARPTAVKPATVTSPVARGTISHVRVQIVTAILHPAATASGKRRKRGRLSVRIRVQNRGEQVVTLTGPVLLVGSERVQTDLRADAARALLEPLRPGNTADATPRFEVAGAVTRQLSTQHQARIIVSGRTLNTAVKVGSPVHPT